MAKDDTIEIEGKVGFVNNKGKIVIPCQYDNVHDFKENYAYVEKDSQKYLINKQGKIITRKQYSKKD